MKYGDVTLGQVEAAINKLGGQKVWDAWLRGEVTVEVEEVIRILFDKHGRRIPQGLQANVCDANRDFHLDQPELATVVDYANRILRLHGALGIDTGITAEQFKQETERLLALIRGNSQIANITNGVWLPVVLPWLTTDDLETTLGQCLEQYLEAVGKSYEKTFSNRKFYNYRKGTLAGEVSFIDRESQRELIFKMKQGPVMGIHFPNPLQGFSINASREQMSTLPPARAAKEGFHRTQFTGIQAREGFILSGLDTAIAMIMYPDILARDCNTPRLDLAALSFHSTDYSLDFLVRGSGLGFDYTLDLASADGSYTSGLLFVG